MAQITNTLKGSHQYMGKVNGKTFVVPHGKLDIYSPNYYKRHSDETITSREHVKQHNPGFSDEEIDAIHDHVNKEHQRQLEESMSQDLNEAKEYRTSSGEVDHKKVDAQYKRNEGQNRHMENAVLLAKHYGTEDDLKAAEKHLSDGKKAGYNVHYAESSKLHTDLLNKMRKSRGEKELHEDVETPPIHVRSTYTKAYAKHHMKGRTEARNASYAEVEKKHGPEMTAKLKAFHDHNEQSISEEKDVFAKHQINIAKKTLRMHPAAAAVMGGPDHEESRKILKKHGWSDEQIKKHELSEEKKYDIYHKGNYHVSTTQSKTAKEAKEKYLKAYPDHKAEDVKVSLSEDMQLNELHRDEHAWHRDLQHQSKPIPGHAYHQSSDAELHQLHAHHSKKAIEKIRTDPQQAKRHQEYADNAKQVLDYRRKTMKEGTQLDELNKSTLKNYIKKAVPELRKHEFDVGSNSMGVGMSRIHGTESSVNTYSNMRDASKKKANKRTKGIMTATDKLVKENSTVLPIVKELIHEAAFTRRHFRQVADIIKSHPDAKKRHEMASHHAEVFAKSNPRFDKKRFFDAAGVKDEGKV